MKRMAAVIVLTGSAGLAWAGAANYFEVTVDAVARKAFGSLYDARRTPDTVQYIGCSVSANAGESATAICEARNAANVRLTCSSQDPEIVKAAQALTDNGYLFFTCEPAPNDILTRVYASKSSIWLP
jgi:hypothetical protein